jgi:hypothetical protein
MYSYKEGHSLSKVMRALTVRLRKLLLAALIWAVALWAYSAHSGAAPAVQLRNYIASFVFTILASIWLWILPLKRRITATSVYLYYLANNESRICERDWPVRLVFYGFVRVSFCDFGSIVVRCGVIRLFCFRRIAQAGLVCWMAQATSRL